MEPVLECKSGYIVHAFIPPCLMFHFKDFRPFALIFFHVFLLCTFLFWGLLLLFSPPQFFHYLDFSISSFDVSIFPQGAKLFFLLPVSPEDTEILYILSSSANILVSKFHLRIIIFFSFVLPLPLDCLLCSLLILY